MRRRSVCISFGRKHHRLTAETFLWHRTYADRAGSIGARGRRDASQKRSMREVPKLDWAQRTTDELAPMVLRYG